MAAQGRPPGHPLPFRGKAQGGAETGPIRILVVAEGRHIFSYLAEPRLQLVRHGFPVPASFEPDIVVCPFVKRYALTAQVMDAELWAKVRAGRVRLVLDASTDLRLHRPDVSLNLHRLLADQQIPARNVAYLTEDRLYGRDYAAWADKQGIGERIQVHFFDYCMRAFAGCFLPNAEGERRLEKKERHFAKRRVHRSKTFISLNRAIRPSKAIVLARLIRDGLWERGHVSAGYFVKPRRSVFVKRMVAAQFEAMAPEVWNGFGKIEARLTQGRNWSPMDGLDSFIEEHSDSYFSLVTETEMHERPHRTTEKPLKALANCQPLLLLGNAGSLQILRDYGFQTFGEYVDESYDLEPDPVKRFEMVYAEFLRQCRLSESELFDQERSMAELLLHNARNMLLDIPRAFASKLEPELLDALMPSGLRGESGREVQGRP